MSKNLQKKSRSSYEDVANQDPHSVHAGMNAAVRATVRVGLYTGAKVYFVHEVGTTFIHYCSKLDNLYELK